MKTSQHQLTSFTTTVVIAQKHLPASTICCLQKLGLVRMVGHHEIFLILKHFYVYPNLNEGVSIAPN